MQRKNKVCELDIMEYIETELKKRIATSKKITLEINNYNFIQ